jgi:hypothetical protein
MKHRVSETAEKAGAKLMGVMGLCGHVSRSRLAYCSLRSCFQPNFKDVQ